MKGKEGTRDSGGQDAKSGRYSSRSGLCPSGEKGFFADLLGATGMQTLQDLHHSIPLAGQIAMRPFPTLVVNRLLRWLPFSPC